MSAFVLKIIALAAMLVDHTGSVFSDYTPFWFRVIGRLTFPIFVYLLAEGFRYTRSREKFLLRLLAFAIISEPFYDWAITRSHNIQQGLGPFHVSFFSYTNIFYTLFLGGAAIVAFEWLYGVIAKSQTQSSGSAYEHSHADDVLISAIAALPVLGFMWLADALGTDYGGYGVLFILIMYVIKPKWLKLTVLAAMNVLQHRYIFQLAWAGRPFDVWLYWMIPATLLTVPLIALYNGKRGPGLKWLFYAAYPAHLAILAAAAWFVL